MKNIKATGLVVMIAGKRHELSLDDARRLRDELIALVGPQQAMTVISYPVVMPLPQQPPLPAQPWWTDPEPMPRITCCASS